MEAGGNGPQWMTMGYNQRIQVVVNAIGGNEWQWMEWMANDDNGKQSMAMDRSGQQCTEMGGYEWQWVRVDEQQSMAINDSRQQCVTLIAMYENICNGLQ